MPKPGWVSGLDVVMGVIIFALLLYVISIGVRDWLWQRDRRRRYPRG